MNVRRKFEFESAHYLPKHPGKCRNLHGHSYVLVVTVDRPVNPDSGMAIDFTDLKEVVEREAVDLLDHRCINDIMENPTAEVMVVWIWNRLIDALPDLVELELHETGNCSVIYRGE